MLRKYVTLAAALMVSVGLVGPAKSATLGLDLGAPILVSESAEAAFFGGELFAFGSLAEGAIGGATQIDIAVSQTTGGFSASALGGLSEVLASASLVDTGFTANTIELLFGNVAGTVDIPSTLLVVLDFGDRFEEGSRTSLFDGLAGAGPLSVDVSAAAIVPLPAPALLLGGGLLMLGAFRRKRMNG